MSEFNFILRNPKPSFFGFFINIILFKRWRIITQTTGGSCDLNSNINIYLPIWIEQKEDDIIDNVSYAIEHEILHREVNKIVFNKLTRCPRRSHTYNMINQAYNKIKNIIQLEKRYYWEWPAKKMCEYED